MGKALFSMCATGDVAAASLALEALHALRQNEASVPVLTGAGVPHNTVAAPPSVRHQWLPDDRDVLQVRRAPGIHVSACRVLHALASHDQRKVVFVLLACASAGPGALPVRKRSDELEGIVAHAGCD